METNYLCGCFKKNGITQESGPLCYISLKSAGGMRFRWNEINKVRENFVEEICQKKYKPLQVELIHSKEVIAVNKIDEIQNVKADGIITDNQDFIPTITVADCVPIYLYEPETKVFGVVHSGWKGTGIIENAINLAKEKYNSEPEDFCIYIGPHIKDCCYDVQKDRAELFKNEYGQDCIREEGKKYFLSLAKANISILKKLGVKEENIVVSGNCTCCNEVFGSFRRQTQYLPKELTPEEISTLFTVQLAWIKWS